MQNQKTLEDLAKQVIDSQSGLMSVEDLKTFFDDKPQATNPVNQVAVEPVIAPTPQASPEPPVTITEPVMSKPTIPDFVPDKFKDGDPATSMERMARSYVELEAELNREREERYKLDGMLQTLSSTPQDTPVSQVEGFDQDDVEESLFFDKPKEATKKVASQVAAAMLMAYHTQLTEASKRVQYVEGFKAQHPDFADYREDMAAILKARPDLDKRVDSLPIVYETAKARHKARLDRMRKELGVTESIPQVQSTQPRSTLTDDQLIERAKTAILEELKKRRAASGITGGTVITSPTERGQPVVAEKPKTPEDRIFEEMMSSGRSKLSIEL
jgi:hypothetical protein